MADRRTATCAQWNIAPDEPLSHYPQAAVDRRAVRDALVSHDLLRIESRHAHRAKLTLAAHNADLCAAAPSARDADDGAAVQTEIGALAMLPAESAGRIDLCEVASPALGDATASTRHNASGAHSTEKATSSTDKLLASGQQYG